MTKPVIEYTQIDSLNSSISTRKERLSTVKNNAWWSNAVVYQIYPRSFQDSNNDGMGDLKGITSRLDYLAKLGVDVIWLSPVYKSPQDDNGYDISDYQDIDPLFGTLEDMDELIARAHSLRIKIIMDLVVNHTSDEHKWFKESSQSRDNTYADWYMWEDPKPGTVGGKPGAEPNNWGSYFGGSAWQWVPERGQYFFHQFSRKQPDLNWDNPEVRQAVFDMMNWWLDRGIDGFRMDVISYISKMRDENGKLRGVAGSLLPERPARKDGFDDPSPDCADGPHLDEYLHQMHEAVFGHRDGYITVGEAPGISPSRAAYVTNPKNRELDMLFLFDHVDIGLHSEAGKWSPYEWKLSDLRTPFMTYENIIENGGWTSLFFCNHDQPRVVSRWGDDTHEAARIRSAKALGLILHMHKGTPYIYQGEELGMTNAHFTSLDQYRDLESINMYHQFTNVGILSPEEMMAGIGRVGRDNARTPMQWDDTTFAGFMNEDSVDEPWISVNENHTVINAASQVDDENSVFTFFHKLIELRHNNPIVSQGDWTILDTGSEQVYAYTRTLIDENDGSEEKWLVVANISGKDAEIPAQTAEIVTTSAPTPDDLILCNENIGEEGLVMEQLTAGTLKPWTAFVIEVR